MMPAAINGAVRVGKEAPMGESEAKYLDVFPAWLRGLAGDAEALAKVVAGKGGSEAVREVVAGGLNYMFKALDLVPDGTDDIGYLDDAFVLRVAADLAIREDTGGLGAEHLRELNRLAGDADTVRAFLGGDYVRLETYVAAQRKAAARGRSAHDIARNAATCDAFMSDVRGFAAGYQPPNFAREDKNLVRLRAFFDAKLPK